MTNEFYPPIGDRSDTRAGFNWRKYWKKGAIWISYRLMYLAIIAAGAYTYHITSSTPAL